jgi:hypothetical protein
MAGQLREVYGTILKPDGAPWATAKVEFRLSAGGYDAAGIYPGWSAYPVTDDSGNFSVELWANDQGSEATTYTCRLPNRTETFSFTLPLGNGSPIDLSSLRAAGEIDANWTESVLSLALGDMVARVDAVGLVNSIEIPDATRGGVLLDLASLRARNALAPLTTPTPDATGEGLHPDVIYFREPWNGYHYWMAFTPYFAANSDVENPCILASNDGLAWEVPAGLTNPIAPKPASGFNSDTELVFANGRLYCLWREVSGGVETVRFLSSADGVSWGGAGVALSSLSSVQGLLSPSFVWFGGEWWCWFVDNVGGLNLKLVKAPSLTGPWSAAETCPVSPAWATGRGIWHHRVRRVGSRWIMLAQDTPTASPGSGGSLWMVESPDGIDWTRATEAALSGRSNVWDVSLYRGTFLLDEGPGGPVLRVWYSTISNPRRIGHTQINVHAGEASHSLTSGALANLLLSTTGLQPYVAGDRFDRADGSIGTMPTGQAWTNNIGTMEIVSGRAKASAATNTLATIDCGIADGEFGCFISASTAAGDAWFSFRGSDNNNRWRCGLTSGGAFRVQKVTSGAVAYESILQPAAAPCFVRVVCSGSSLRFFLNGNEVLAITDSAHSTATRIGIQCSNITARFAGIYAKTESTSSPWGE